MLVLTRKAGQSLVIGEDIYVTVLEIRGDQVRIGIEAPRHLPVHREEIYELIRSENVAAVQIDTNAIQSLNDLLGPNKPQEKD